jgi:hypothetical protein
MVGPLTAQLALKAFEALDAELDAPVRLILGGGTAMMLAHGLPVRTADVDAYPRNASLEPLLPAVRRVGRALGLSPDWLNPHFETFAHVLPADHGSRLVPVYAGKHLEVSALGAEDLLVMKCFAGREKDVGHARALLRRHPDLSLVERRLQELAERGLKGAQDALDFFDELAGSGA